MGYFEGEASGTFDAATRTAVKAFQKDNKLTADGVVGDKTMKKMFDPEAKHAREKKPAKQEPKKAKSNTQASTKEEGPSQNATYKEERQSQNAMNKEEEKVETTEEVIF